LLAATGCKIERTGNMGILMLERPTLRVENNVDEYMHVRKF